MKHFFFLILCLPVLLAGASKPSMEIFQTGFASSKGWVVQPSKGSSATFGLAERGGGLPVKFKLGANGVIVLRCTQSFSVVPDRIQLKLEGDGSMNQVSLRLIDASGETFRYPVAQLKKGLLDLIVNPQKAKHENWGGNKNRKIDLPVQAICVEIRDASRYWKCQPEGVILLNRLSVLSSEAGMKSIQKAGSSSGVPILTAVRKGEAPVFVDMKTASGKTTGKLAASYDADSVTIHVRAFDATPNFPESGHGIYQNDCIELWIDAKMDSLFGLTQEDDAQIVVTPKNSRGVPEFRVYRNSRSAYFMADGVLKAKTGKDGWEAELTLPLDGLPGLRNDKKAIGFSANLVDNQGKSIEKSYWGGTIPPQFGMLTFGTLSAKELAERKNERQHRLAILRGPVSDPMKNTYRGAPSIHSVQVLTGEPKQFERFELALGLDAEFKNPFDFNEVNLFAEFTAPSGKTVKTDGFLYRKYELLLFGRDAETIRPSGEPEWRIRFAPTEKGVWKYRIGLRDRHGKTTSLPEKSFTAAASKNPGFLRVSPRDSRYLAFDDGSSFFGLGFASHSWNPRNLVLYTKHYLNQLAAFGGNYTSINLEVPGNGGFGLQVGKNLGVYSLENAFRLDYILECAERRGIYLLPCMHQTGLGMLRMWNGSIYNRKNGGPCDSVADFFSSPEMRTLIKNRLRYLVARWGYSTNILGFEIFNEVNYTDGFKTNPGSVVDFHRDLAAYMKQIDPNKHLMSTCFGSGDACELPEIWRLPEIDFTVTHSYANDIAGALFERQRTKALYEKPTIGGENGIGANLCGQAQSADPEGISFHNNLWASLVTKSAGNVLQWWYSHLHDPLDFYAAHYPQFKKFIADIPFDRENFQCEELYALRSSAGHSDTVRLFPFEQVWAETDFPEYTLNSDGIWWKSTSEKTTTYEADMDRTRKADALPGILLPKGQPGHSLTLRCTLPADSFLRLRPSATGRKGGRLIFRRNGKPAADHSLADRDGKNDPYANEFDSELVLPLKAGENLLEIRNDGASFVSLKDLRIDRLGSAAHAEHARVGVLSGKRTKIVWIQNKQNTWYRKYRGESADELRGLRLPLSDITGVWELSWYDPYRGEYIQTQRTRFEGKGEILIPPFKRDLALKMKKISPSPSDSNR